MSSFQYNNRHFNKKCTRPFYGGGSVVVDLLFYVPPIVCGGSVLGFCFNICITLNPF